MPRLTELRVFFREFVANFHTTGAILPSGRFLAKALSRFVAAPGQGRMILEVGPGTGAVTQRIAGHVRPTDELHLVELNDAFVAQLRRRLETEPPFQAVAAQTRIFHCPVEDLPQGNRYDVIVSGLPLNNFSVEMVERILAALVRLLKPGGVLSFFEYIAIRRARSLVSGRQERARLHGIGRALAGLLDGREIRRDAVWLNVPPAWVHHVRN
jgi:phospholipid N-methyltransferase